MNFTVKFKNGFYTKVCDAPCFGSMQGDMPYNNKEDKPSPSSSTALSCTFHAQEDCEGLSSKASEILLNNHQKLLPQFFSGCEWGFDDDGILENFTAPMGENLIQSTMFALRSIRNLSDHRGVCKLFEDVFEKTEDVNLAFLVSQCFYKSQTYDSKFTLFHNTDRDSCVIDYLYSTVEDFNHLYNGGIGFDFQGRWCDSEYGYGSYGSMPDGSSAPVFNRTENEAHLWSNSLKTELEDPNSLKLRVFKTGSDFSSDLDSLIKKLRG